MIQFFRQRLSPFWPGHFYITVVCASKGDCQRYANPNFAVPGVMILPILKLQIFCSYLSQLNIFIVFMAIP